MFQKLFTLYNYKYVNDLILRNQLGGGFSNDYASIILILNSYKLCVKLITEEGARGNKNCPKHYY